MGEDDVSRHEDCCSLVRLPISERVSHPRLRERWHPTAHSNVVEFRDGVHGVLSWAIAASVSGLVIAASVAGVASKAVAPC
jgi:hypothetical protein